MKQPSQDSVYVIQGEGFQNTALEATYYVSMTILIDKLQNLWIKGTEEDLFNFIFGKTYVNFRKKLISISEKYFIHVLN